MASSRRPRICQALSDAARLAAGVVSLCLSATSLADVCDVVDVSAGGAHTCGVRPSGAVVCWGDNLRAQSIAPSGWPFPFLLVRAGGTHTCAMQSDNRLVCWGNNAFGQATPPSGTYLRLSAGGNHTCAVRSTDWTCPVPANT